MRRNSVHSPRIRSLAVAAATVVVALTFSVTAAQRPQYPAEPSKAQDSEGRTAAQLMYPDAPDGVDPVTTGPVSRDFRERQRAAQCDKAVWPDIPVICYP